MAAIVTMEHWTQRTSDLLASPDIPQTAGASSDVSRASSSSLVADCAPTLPESEPEPEEKPRYTQQEKGKGRTFDPPGSDTAERSDDGELAQEPVDPEAAQVASERLIALLLEEDRAMAAQHGHAGSEPDVDDQTHRPDHRVDALTPDQPTSPCSPLPGEIESDSEEPSAPHTPRTPASRSRSEDDLYVPSSQKHEWELARPLAVIWPRPGWDATTLDEDVFASEPTSQTDEEYLTLPVLAPSRLRTPPSPEPPSPGYWPESPKLKRKRGPLDELPLSDRALASPKTPRLHVGPPADSPRAGSSPPAVPATTRSPVQSSQLSPLGSTQSILRAFMDSFSPSQSTSVGSQTQLVLDQPLLRSPAGRIIGLGLDFGSTDAAEDNIEDADGTFEAKSAHPDTQVECDEISSFDSDDW
jgi:hypothetical protein